MRESIVFEHLRIPSSPCNMDASTPAGRSAELYVGKHDTSPTRSQAAFVYSRTATATVHTSASAPLPLQMHPARFCRNPLMLPQTLDEQRRDGELYEEGGDDNNVSPAAAAAGRRRHLYQAAQVRASTPPRQLV